MEYHPVSKIFPLMTTAELKCLNEDIRANGLREPIWLHPDKRIIDGRNRYLACIEAKVEPNFAEWNEAEHGELIGFVLSRNIHRRHLSESQRAIAAAKAATMRRGERTDLASIEAKSSQSGAADLLNVSRSSTQRASLICEKGVSGLVDLVRDGHVTVGAASLVAKLPLEEQEELVADGAAAIKSKASSMRGAVEKRRQAAAPRDDAASLETANAEAEESRADAAESTPAGLRPGSSAATAGITTTESASVFDISVIFAEPKWRIPGLSPIKDQASSAVNGLDASTIKGRISHCLDSVTGDGKVLLLRVSPYLHEDARRVLQHLKFDHLLDIPVVPRLATSGAMEHDGDHDYVLLGVQGDTSGLDYAALVQWLDERRHAPTPTVMIVSNIARQLSRGQILDVSWADTDTGGRRV